MSDQPKLSHAESVVLIDEQALDKECIRLPSDYLKYANKTIERKRDTDELRSALKVLEAKLSLKIRENPQDYGLEKVTEAALSTTVISQKEHREMSEQLRAAQYEADIAQAVVNALEHKKRSLTLLVELHGLGYFASPKVSEKGRKELDDMTKRAVRTRSFREDT